MRNLLLSHTCLERAQEFVCEFKQFRLQIINKKYKTPEIIAFIWFGINNIIKILFGLICENGQSNTVIYDNKGYLQWLRGFTCSQHKIYFTQLINLLHATQNIFFSDGIS